MSTTFIYALCEPNGRVRYVGKANNPKYRATEHVRKSIKMKTHLGSWIRSLVLRGEKPVLEILDEVPDTQWAFWEREYIRVFRAIGMDLVNTSEGGEGLTMTPEIRAKISSGNLGKKRSLETRALLSAQKTGTGNPNFGKNLSPEICAKMSASRTGMKLSIETRSKMSLSRLGEKNPFFGKKRTEESLLKQKITKARNKLLKETL